MAHPTPIQQIYWQYIIEPFHDDLPDNEEQCTFSLIIPKERSHLISSHRAARSIARVQHWYCRFPAIDLQKHTEPPTHVDHQSAKMKHHQRHETVATQRSDIAFADRTRSSGYAARKIGEPGAAYERYAEDMRKVYGWYKDAVFPAIRRWKDSKFLVSLKMRIQEHDTEMEELPIEKETVEDEMKVIRSHYPPNKVPGNPREYLWQKAWSSARKDIRKFPHGDPRPFAIDNRPGASWVSVKELGQGGMGRVSLEVLYDQYGTVLNRMAKKITNAGRVGASISPDTWKLFPDDRLAPLEGVIQSYMNFARFTVKAIGHPWISHTPDGRYMHYTMFMSYAARGDFQTIIEQHRFTQVAVPETFAWLVFKALANTACLMKKGAVDNPPVAGWEEIVHRDLKPDSIFLDLEDPNHFASFPQPL